MNKVHSMIALAFIILIGLLYISIRLEIPQKIIGSIAESIQKTPEELQQEQEREQERLIAEIANDGARAGAGGGGGGSGGSGASSQTSGVTTPSCQTISVSYVLENIRVLENCNAYQGSNCIDKDVLCQTDITNLDYQISGEFQIILQFTNAQTFTTIQTISQTINLSPRQTETLAEEINLLNSEAQQEVTCSVQSVIGPTKQVCS